PDEDRVRLVAFLLKGNAYHWWKTGSMSMLEYEHKFNELSRFAPELIPTKEEKCRRFEEGLWLDIQAVVIATTYSTMRALTQAVDHVAKKLSASSARHRRDTTGFGGPSQGPSKRGGSSSSSASSGCMARDPSRQTSSTCHNRGQVGHFKSECPLLSLSGTMRQETGALQGQGSRG
ncbi:unnamed protein product, partial [Prunus brigantina]